MNFTKCKLIGVIINRYSNNHYIRLQLIKPEELVSPNMDELSMMTYLSQYPNAKLKQGAPLRPKTNANR